MKRTLSILLTVLMLISVVPLTSFARTEETAGPDGAYRTVGAVTVADGDVQNVYLPTYEYYKFGKSQYIIPASYLTGLVGKTITGLRWYFAGDAAVRRVTVYLSETSDTTLTGLVNVYGCTAAFYYEDWSVSGQEAWVELSRSYVYKGGNLLITILDWTDGYTGGVLAYGERRNGASWSVYSDEDSYYNFDTYGGASRDFIPKTTLSYKEEEDGFVAGDTIEYGRYPQTRVTDPALISALNASVTDSDWISYNYCEGDNNRLGVAWFTRTAQRSGSVLSVSPDNWGRLTGATDGDNTSNIGGIRPALRIELPAGTNARDVITFGSYPQTLVSDKAILSKLNALSLDWHSYDYWLYGSRSDFMRYADAVCDGERYRAVIFEETRGYAYLGELPSDTVYWFRWEPITWRVLDPASGLVVSEKMIDAQKYHYYCERIVLYPHPLNPTYQNDKHGWTAYYGNEEHTHYASNYYYSEIRAWLNGEFLDWAFSTSEKSGILYTYLDNSCKFTLDGEEGYDDYDSPASTDRIFLLSASDVENPDYFDREFHETVSGGYYTYYDCDADWTDYNFIQGWGGCGTSDIYYYNEMVFDGSARPGDFMRYADVVYNGEKYRGVAIDEYRTRWTGLLPRFPWISQYAAGYSKGEVYWFKYEPVTWIVIDPEEGLVLAELVLDAQPFNQLIYYNAADDLLFVDPEMTKSASDWNHSYLRRWMNGTFFDTAFDESQKANVKTSTLKNDKDGAGYYVGFADSEDRLFALSSPEIGYYYSSDCMQDPRSTDYSFSQGKKYNLNWSYPITWWSRSSWLVSHDEYFEGYSNLEVYGAANLDPAAPDDASVGVRPAMRLYELRNDSDMKYCATFVADGTVVDRVWFRAGQTSISEPEVPKKNGYNGVWEPYTLGACDITVNAIYTPDCSVTIAETYSEIINYRESQCFEAVVTNPPDGLVYRWYLNGAEASETSKWFWVNDPENNYTVKVEIYDGGAFLAESEEIFIGVRSECDMYGHLWDEWSYTVTPTCTAAGERTHTCMRCGFTDTEPVDPLGHDYKAAVTEPGCTDGGYTTYTCSRCGDSYTADFTDPLGHNWGEWKQTKDPDCTAKGEESRACSRCGATEKRDVAALGHNYSSSVTPPTCTEKGYTAHTCTRCGDTYKDDYTDALGHDFSAEKTEDRYLVSAATCEQPAVYHKSCTRCGAASPTDTFTHGDPLGHAWTEWVLTLAPTETEKGEETRLCTRCGKIEKREVPELAHVHNYDNVVTTPPTCTEKGYTTHTCRCGDFYVDNYTDPLGHSYSSETTSPTCTEPGYIIHTCTRCSDSYREEYTAALGHNFNVEAAEDRYLVTAADCEHAAVYCRSCSRCGAGSESETFTSGKPLGHSWSEWTVTIAPTLNDKGEEARTCERCGKTETRMVLPLELVNPFTDIKKGQYFYTPVLWAYYYEPQITAGITDTLFGPQETCTRAQIVTFLWKAAGAPEPETAENPFTDVKKSAYYYKAVLWAVENGITAGLTPTTFGPKEPCKRCQVVTFLWRFAGSPEPLTDENPFEDVKPNAYYNKAVRWAKENDITAGVTSSIFGSNYVCTRAQIVTFLYKYLHG